MIVDLASQAYNALRHNRRRSVLTMLGMAWESPRSCSCWRTDRVSRRGLWAAFRSFGTNLVSSFPAATELQAGGTKAARRSD